MIIYGIVCLVQDIINFLLNLLPQFESPDWLSDNLNWILRAAYGFDYFLPVSEAVTVVIFCIGVTFAWKIFRVLVSPFFDL